MAENRVARRMPDSSCTIRVTPSRDPQFHITEMLAGVGRSITTPLIMFTIGLCLRNIVLTERDYIEMRAES